MPFFGEALETQPRVSITDHYLPRGGEGSVAIIRGKLYINIM